jgi:hypothetical protein
MSFELYCHHCRNVTVVHRPPVIACPYCDTLWSPDRKVAAEAALAGEGLNCPALLTLGIPVSFFCGGLITVILALAVLGYGRFSLNGGEVTGPELLRRTGLQFFVLAGCLFASSYGVAMKRTWARRPMMLFWFIALTWGVGSAIGDGDLAGQSPWLLTWLVMTGCAWLYLYEKANVIAYFRALEVIERARAGASTAP